MTPFQKILVPTDFSAHAERATLLAADLSRRYDAELTLLHVHEPMAYELPDGHVMNMPSQLDVMFAELNQHLAEVQHSARAAGATRVDTRLLQGPIVREIVTFSGGFDLVVMGTQGRTGLARLMLGSIAERVVQTAPCPVLVVRLPQSGAAHRATTALGDPAGETRTR